MSFILNLILYIFTNIKRTIVISFYSGNWKEQGLKFINQLNEINTEIRANGGNHIIITDSRSPELEKAAWDNSLSLNFYFDAAHKFAGRFGGLESRK